MRRATQEERALVERENHKLGCWRCARFGGMRCGDIICNSNLNDGKYMRMSPEYAAACSDCFVWDIRHAAFEALSRLEYIGADQLNPAIGDVMELLRKSCEQELVYERKDATP